MNLTNSIKNRLSTNVEAMALQRSASIASLETYPSHQHNPHYDCHHHCHVESRELSSAPNAKTGLNNIDESFLKNLASMIGISGATTDNSKIEDIIKKIKESAAHGAAYKPTSGNEAMAQMNSDLTNIVELSNRADMVIGASGSTSRDKLAHGVAATIIGGCCCVDLSIEYLPSNILDDSNCAVAVATQDTSGTICSWAQICGSQSGYEIREHIISTNPGARLVVLVLNLVARVRWCEHFAC